MTRDLLYQCIITNLSIGSISGVTSLIIENNELAKSFDSAQLAGMATAFKACQINNPVLYNFYVQNMLFQKNDAGAFINELPFATMAELGVTRYFMPHKLGTPEFGYVGFPDCIDVDNMTGELQGIQLKNHMGQQYLKPLSHGIRYEILTTQPNLEYYKITHTDAKVFTYSNLPKGPFQSRLVHTDYMLINHVAERFVRQHGILLSRYKF